VRDIFFFLFFSLFANIFCDFFFKETIRSLIHHTIILASYLLAIYHTPFPFGIYFILCFQCMELTCFNCNMRWFMETAGYTGNTLYIVNALSWVLEFFFFRIIGGSWTLFQVFYQMEPNVLDFLGDSYIRWFVVGCAVSMMLLQYFFWYMIVKGLISFASGGQPDPEGAKKKRE